MAKRKSDRSTDVPGNSVASAQAYQRQLVKASEALMSLEDTLSWYEDEEKWVYSIRVSMPSEDRDEYLGVIKASGVEGDQIAFHQGGTYLETLVGVAQRLKNRTLKWRDDEYGNKK